MWIEAIELCPDCGAEVTLYTDGRSAYAVNDGLGTDLIASGDTSEAWRDGQSLTIRCPGIRKSSDRVCDAELHFIGEGSGTYVAQRMEPYAEPILEEEPLTW